MHQAPCAIAEAPAGEAAWPADCFSHSFLHSCLPMTFMPDPASECLGSAQTQIEPQPRLQMLVGTHLEDCTNVSAKSAVLSWALLS